MKTQSAKMIKMEHNKELITIFFFLSKVSKKQCLPYPVVLIEEIYKYIYVCVYT